MKIQHSVESRAAETRRAESALGGDYVAQVAQQRSNLNPKGRYQQPYTISVAVSRQTRHREP